MATSPIFRFMRILFPLLLLALLPIIFNPCSAEAGRTVRVGIYQSGLLANFDKNGSAHGLFVDILNHIAQKEQWTVEYMPGTWQEGLDRLKTDKIDLVLCIGYSEERDKQMDFPKEFLLLNWGVLYKAKGSSISSLLDLEGKSVSALKGDIYLTGFRTLAKQFNVNVKIQEVDQYSEVFKAIKSGEVSAGVAGIIYGILNENARDAEQTPVIFSPIKLGYAVNHGKNGDLITALDRNIAALKADKASIYYHDLEHLLGNRELTMPKWAYWILSGILATLILAISFIILLRRQVKTKTKNVLEAAEQYKIILQSASDGYWSVDNYGNLQEVNTRYVEMSGFSSSELIGMPIEQIEVYDSAADVQKRIKELKEVGFIRFESQHRRKDGTVWDVEVSASYLPIKDTYIGFIRDISEEKQAEAEREYAILRFNGIMDSLDALIYVADMQTHEILFLNEYGRNQFGDIVGKICWQSLQAGQSAPCTFCTNNRLILENGDPADVYTWEFQNTVNRHWYECRDKAIRWHDGRLVRLEIATDITERKRNEEQMASLSQRYLLATTSAKLGIWDWNVRENTMVWDSRMFELYGITPDTFPSNIDAWLNGLHPEDKETAVAECQTALKGEKEFDTVFRVLHPDGTVIYLKANALVIRGTDGTAERMLGINVDITESKQAEQKLLESEERFKKLFSDHSAVMLLIQPESGKIIDANLAAEKFYRYSNEELLSMNIDHINDLAPELINAEMDAAVKENRNHFIFPHRLSDGEIRTVEVYSTPIKVNNSTLLFSIIQDITSRKRAEEEKQILEQQFQQTQKLESLGVLAGGIAHDFNNILAIIMGYCSLTKLDYKSAEKYISEIETASERAAALCRQMLAYAGKAQLAKTQVNMRTMVDEMVTMLKSTLPQNAVIKPDLCVDIPFIIADDSQIRQIVMNLIINASEAVGTEQGDINVSLTNKTVAADHQDIDYLGNKIPSGGYLCLEVTDNGCGMNKETKKRIFEPFYTTKFTGRGLGMSAVLGIIKSHGGALQLHSELGRGTTFRVYLPVQESDSNGNEGLNQSVPTIIWRGSGTILLVEDEDQVRLIAKAVLKKIGFTVLEAVNGKEALELYKRHATEISLVMTDMGMPIMDGYELFHELKKLNPKLPIIVSSGYGDAEVTSRTAPEDIAGLISKPYNYDQLREVLRGVLEEKVTSVENSQIN